MAGVPSNQSLDNQQPPRPVLYPQGSNSVPSTPYQRPRDVSRRFSRSPSPNRTLGNQSPRSVVSEQVGNGSHRGAPVMCKYETGDEFRKRRMGYTEGGDRELGPPKKEPRRTLQPHEQEKLSGDMRELYDRLLPSQESEDRRTQLVQKLDRILNEEWPGNDIRVNVFGSSGNLLSSTDSDVDICITTPLKKLELMHELAALLDRHGMKKVVCRAAAKVPIVKCWDPELELATDLNVNNPLALQNTRLIKTYVQLDDRVRPLAKIIKHWTKQRILNDAAFGATISSYTWICMIISFLQRRNPPILPSLQKMDGHRLPSQSGEDSTFADDVEALKGYGAANTESLGELLFQFFRHYGYEFEYSKYVVSVKEGRLLSRQEKGWDNISARENKEARHRLCVEEPFTTHRNLGNTADDYAWHGTHLEIRRAFELLEDGLQLEKCCEQYEFPKEEKPVFQKPPPKPKPTLTRSASQSGRQPPREPGSARSRKGNNRQQSTQRSNNRRASSGASFGNHRVPFSPPLGTPSSDYFQLRGTLHEQLYQQYQFLQAQQDALRTQLVQQQQQAQQVQTRVGDLASTPRPRQFANGLPSPRPEHPPPTAPLPLSYLYHYTARYPPPSPVSQARSREGTSTNPSSPSLVAAVPGLNRRQMHRASVPDGSANSVRSQSQPGRSLPSHLALQQQQQANIDMAAAIAAGQLSGGPRTASQVYPHGYAAMPFGPFTAIPQGLENAMPKDYVGYMLGQSQSHQLGPQQYATANSMPPPMALRDPPPRQRRVTPDLMPPVLNGRQSSRSPSPLSHPHGTTTVADRRTSHPVILQSPSIGFEQQPAPVIAAPAPDGDVGGPLIVNGSNRNPALQVTDRANGNTSGGLHIQTDVALPVQSLPFHANQSCDPGDAEGRRHSSPRISPSSKVSKHDRVFSPLSPPNGTPKHTNGYSETTPLSAAPLLSPVAELRTPSPTQSRSFDEPQRSPEANGNLVRAAKIANAKQVQRETAEYQRQDDRRKSVPMYGAAKSESASMGPSLQGLTSNAHLSTWQQVPKKGHKKNNKSMNGARSPNTSGGQPLPANEADRKGG